MGVTYGILFAVMGLLLLHPTIGLANTVANPYRPLGWISYGTQCIITSDALPSFRNPFCLLFLSLVCVLYQILVTIESFGSMVVQCFWALVNSSVDTKFAKKNFGYIVAGLLPWRGCLM